MIVVSRANARKQPNFNAVRCVKNQDDGDEDEQQLPGNFRILNGDNATPEAAIQSEEWRKDSKATGRWGDHLGDVRGDENEERDVSNRNAQV